MAFYDLFSHYAIVPMTNRILPSLWSSVASAEIFLKSPRQSRHLDAFHLLAGRLRTRSTFARPLSIKNSAVKNDLKTGSPTCHGQLFRDNIFATKLFTHHRRLSLPPHYWAFGRSLSLCAPRWTLVRAKRKLCHKRGAFSTLSWLANPPPDPTFISWSYEAKRRVRCQDDTEGSQPTWMTVLVKARSILATE